MGFGHEKLDVYHAAIEYVGWVYRYCETMKGHRGYVVNEESAQYSVDLIDPDLSYIAQRATEDSDTDTDPDESKENTETPSVNRIKKCV